MGVSDCSYHLLHESVQRASPLQCTEKESMSPAHLAGLSVWVSWCEGVGRWWLPLCVLVTRTSLSSAQAREELHLFLTPTLDSSLISNKQIYFP